MRKFIYLLLFGNLACVIFSWGLGSSGDFLRSGQGNLQIIAIGRLAGLLLEFSILLQLIFMGRVRWIERQFGHDKLNRIHRLLGYSLSVFLVLHPLLITLGYA